MFRTVLAATAACALLGAATGASALTVDFGGQVNPSIAPNVAPPVFGLSGAVIVSGGHDFTYNGWDPYGDTAGGGAATDLSHAWLSISDGGSASVDAAGRLTLIWGSVNDWPAPGNVIDFYNGSTLVGEVTAGSLYADGFPVANTGAPGYLVTISGGFTRATLLENGGGDFEVGFAAVPEASTWAMMGVGFLALAFAGARSRRTPVAAFP